LASPAAATSRAMRQFDGWRPRTVACNHRLAPVAWSPAMSQLLYSFFGAILGSGIFLLAGREPLRKLIEALKHND
jgi:hypothetical protein